jgi:hypothetical protein
LLQKPKTFTDENESASPKNASKYRDALRNKKAKIGFLVFPFEGILYSSGESEIYKLSEEFISFGEIEKRELC